MQKVLIGYTHSHGTIKESGIAFDNINLYVADWDEGDINDGGCVGFAPYSDPIKVKFSEFYSVVGMSYDEFCARFAQDLQFHQVRDIYGLNRYKRPILQSLTIIEDDVIMMSPEDLKLEKGGK